MQNNLTPLSTTFFIFALCTSYMFITMNNAQYSYVADYKYIMFKILIVISTIALGFLTTVFSCSLYAIDNEFVRTLVTNYDFTRNHLVQTFMLYVSSIWMALAIALLPFSHTVYDNSTGTVDVDRTQQLMVVQQTVYSGPYYMLMLLMSVFLFVFFLVVGHTYNQRPWLDTEQLESAQQMGDGGSSARIAQALKIGAKAQSTFGCYFRIDENDLRQIGEQ